MAAHRSAQGCCKRQSVVHVPNKKQNKKEKKKNATPPGHAGQSPPRHTSKVASMLRCFNLWFAPSSFPVGRWCLENYNYQSKAQREVYVRHNGSHQHAPLDFSVAVAVALSLGATAICKPFLLLAPVGLYLHLYWAIALHWEEPGKPRSQSARAYTGFSTASAGDQG